MSAIEKAIEMLRHEAEALKNCLTINGEWRGDPAQEEYEQMLATTDSAIAERDALRAELDAPREWINPNDKTQAQYLPHIGEPCLFAHGGRVYYGHHTGGSFRSGHGFAAKSFSTWDCFWMPMPEAPKPEETK